MFLFRAIAIVLLLSSCVSAQDVDAQSENSDVVSEVVESDDLGSGDLETTERIFRRDVYPETEVEGDTPVPRRRPVIRPRILDGSRVKSWGESLTVFAIGIVSLVAAMAVALIAFFWIKKQVIS